MNRIYLAVICVVVLGAVGGMVVVLKGNGNNTPDIRREQHSPISQETGITSRLARSDSGVPTITRAPVAAQALSASLTNATARQLVEMLATATSRGRARIAEALLEQRSAAVVELRRIMTNGTLELRLFACNMIMRMQDSSCSNELIVLLRDDRDILVAAAINALRETEGNWAIPHLKDILRSSTSGDEKTVCALWAMGHLGSHADVESLRPFLKSDDPRVPTVAAAALAMLGSAEAREVLLRGITSSAPFVARVSVQGLGYLDDAESESQLKQIIDRPGATWKTDAHISLLQRNLRSIPTESAKIKALINAVDGSNKAVTEWALTELADINSVQSLDYLKQVSKQATRSGQSARFIIKARGIQ